MYEILTNNKIVDIIQFTRNNISDVLNFTNEKLCNVEIPKSIDGIMTGLILDEYGKINLTEGDLIFKDENMKFHVYKLKKSESRKDIVLKLYEYLYNLEDVVPKFGTELCLDGFKNIKPYKDDKWYELSKLVNLYMFH